ncbi:MAG: manganese efflux pump [Bacilli bacterium]|nr:manganese efflux pump [Bacilli bacterium]
MMIIDILLVSISLASDAFAVSICKGMTLKDNKITKGLIIGFYFALFQFLMPIVGCFFANYFKGTIINIDHWIAFILLAIIGIKMIKDAILEENNLNSSINIKSMIPLALATSIDALAIGITFSFLNINLINSVIIIGIVTFIMSLIGTVIGNKVGETFGKKAQIFGGIVLFAIGLKILFEHLNLI